jgi:hypothetical protein
LAKDLAVKVVEESGLTLVEREALRELDAYEEVEGARAPDA